MNIKEQICLDPYSNGMKIEQIYTLGFTIMNIVLILILME